jgi:hypothetical protein
MMKVSPYETTLVDCLFSESVANCCGAHYKPPAAFSIEKAGYGLAVYETSSIPESVSDTLIVNVVGTRNGPLTVAIEPTKTARIGV